MEKTHEWVFFASAFVLAFLVKVATSVGEPSVTRIVCQIFSPRIWLHRSSRLDLLLILGNAVIAVAILPPALYAAPRIADWVQAQLAGLFGAHTAVAGEPTLLPSLLFTLLLLLLADFVSYVVHVVLHKVPALWHLHKVHHSAEVLTPFTAQRFHPFEDWFTVVNSSLVVGVGMGVIQYVCRIPVGEVTIYGMNLFIFILNFAGGLLTHSHIWLHWPRPIARIVISPAMHQIHHSKAERHRDKNFGAMFSLWDVLFGTAYVPRKKERLAFGLAGVKDHPHTVRAAYFGAVRDMLAELGGSKPNARRD